MFQSQSDIVLWMLPMQYLDLDLAVQNSILLKRSLHLFTVFHSQQFWDFDVKQISRGSFLHFTK